MRNYISLFLIVLIVSIGSASAIDLFDGVDKVSRTSNLTTEAKNALSLKGIDNWNVSIKEEDGVIKGDLLSGNENLPSLPNIKLTKTVCSEWHDVGENETLDMNDLTLCKTFSEVAKTDQEIEDEVFDLSEIVMQNYGDVEIERAAKIKGEVSKVIDVGV